MPPLARRPLVLGLALLAAVLCWAAAGPGRYGYHRDELYFLSAGRRPAWGYPDQPPLTPVLARITELVHPHSELALRIPAILVALWVTLAAALIARELGGGMFAQLLAAFAVGSGVLVLMSGHLLATSTVDLGIWVTASWLATRALRTGSARGWLAVGAVLGVGLLNKQLPVMLAAGLAVGLLLTPAARPVLRSGWPYAGAALAALAWAPVLWWQARNGWPQVTLAEQIRAEYGTPGGRMGFAATQLVLFSLGATVLWVTGLVRLVRDDTLARYRPLAWAWLTALAIVAVTAGQVYYIAGTYPALIAVGAVTVERWRRRALVVAGTAVSALVMLPAALPLLPPATLDDTAWAEIAEPLRESVGWPGLVEQVARAHRNLPAESRSSAVVFTANYGQAGAVEEYGAPLGLPLPAYSGHNGFAAWGPPAEDRGPVLLVWQGDPSRVFAGCRPQGRVQTGVRNEESEESSVYICEGPVGGWRAVWPRVTHLSA